MSEDDRIFKENMKREKVIAARVLRESRLLNPQKQKPS
jgi:hypothetical protein